MDAETFKNIRRSTGLTVREFATAMNPDDPLPERAITRWEKGERRVSESAADLAAGVVDRMDQLVDDLVQSIEDRQAVGDGQLPPLITWLTDESAGAAQRRAGVTATMHFLSTHRAAALLRANGLDVEIVTNHQCHKQSHPGTCA